MSNIKKRNAEVLLLLIFYNNTTAMDHRLFSECSADKITKLTHQNHAGRRNPLTGW